MVWAGFVGFQVDESFRHVLNSIAADPLLRTFSEIHEIQAKLEGMLNQLDACQTALLEFLEAKRSLFPRYGICALFCHLEWCYVEKRRRLCDPKGGKAQTVSAIHTSTTDKGTCILIDEAAHVV